MEQIKRKIFVQSDFPKSNLQFQISNLRVFFDKALGVRVFREYWSLESDLFDLKLSIQNFEDTSLD